MKEDSHKSDTPWDTLFQWRTIKKTLLIVYVFLTTAGLISAGEPSLSYPLPVKVMHLDFGDERESAVATSIVSKVERELYAQTNRFRRNESDDPGWMVVTISSSPVYKAKTVNAIHVEFDTRAADLFHLDLTEEPSEFGSMYECDWDNFDHCVDLIVGGVDNSLDAFNAAAWKVITSGARSAR